MNTHDIEQMRAEDRRYGEKQARRREEKQRRSNNQVNYTRFSTKELASMQDDDDFDMDY